MTIRHKETTSTITKFPWYQNLTAASKPLIKFNLHFVTVKAIVEATQSWSKCKKITESDLRIHRPFIINLQIKTQAHKEGRSHLDCSFQQKWNLFDPGDSCSSDNNTLVPHQATSNQSV